MLSSTLRPFKSFTRLQLIFRPGGGGCGGQGSCSKGEHTLDPSDHDNHRCDDDKYNCDDDHIWQLLLWPWQSNPCDDESQWQDLCNGDNERRGWWWSMTIIFATMTMHDNQWQTQDWGGLVDIVLRGEAALLENKKSGEKHDNETSYKLFKITVTSYLECIDLFEAWKYQRQHSWCKAFTDDKELQEFLNNSVAFKTKIENIQKGDMISYFSVLRIVMRFEEQNWNNLFLISCCWRLTQGSSSQPWQVCS